MGNCLGLCVTKFLGLSEELDLDCDYQLSLLEDRLRPRGYSFIRIPASRLTEVMMPDDSDYILIVDIINEGLHAVLCKGRDTVKKGGIMGRELRELLADNAALRLELASVKASLRSAEATIQHILEEQVRRRA